MRTQTKTPGAQRRGRGEILGGVSVRKPKTLSIAAAVGQAVAYLHAAKRGRGDRFDVVFDGERIVEGSHVAELDAARALHAKGIVGRLTIIDGATGKPRTIINIEAAAKLTVREDRHDGPRFATWRPMPEIVRQRCAGRAPAAETPSGGEGHRPHACVAVAATRRRAAA
jgi:hypothetical protein